MNMAHLCAKRKVVDENDVGLVDFVAPFVAEEVALDDLVAAVQLVKPLHALFIVVLHELRGTMSERVGEGLRGGSVSALGMDGRRQEKGHEQRALWERRTLAYSAGISCFSMPQDSMQHACAATCITTWPTPVGHGAGRERGPWKPVRPRGRDSKTRRETACTEKWLSVVGKEGVHSQENGREPGTLRRRGHAPLPRSMNLSPGRMGTFSTISLIMLDLNSP